MSGHDIIVVGSSAGGMGALSDLIKGLPADLPAAIFVVRHISAHSKNALPDILNRRGEAGSPSYRTRTTRCIPGCPAAQLRMLRSITSCRLQLWRPFW